MTKSKKAIFGMLSMLLVAAVAVAGVVMWLTAQTQVVTNTFTVGNIEVTLDEKKVTEYGVEVEGAARVTANTYKLIPGQTYTKDPVIHIAEGSEPAYVFVKVDNGIAGAEVAADAVDPTIAEQMTANGWTPVSGAAGIYVLNEAKDARTAAIDVPVFESFTIADEVEGFDSYAGKTITIKACLVQSSGITLDEATAEAEAALNAANA